MIESDKVDVVLGILTDAMRAKLDSSDRTRFAHVMRLCQQAQSFMRLGGKRVKDFPPNVIANQYIAGGLNFGGEFPPLEDDGELANVQGAAMGALQGGPIDQAGIVRELLMLVTPHLTQMQRQGLARERADVAAQLASLMNIRDSLVTSALPGDAIRNTAIEKQIDLLMTQLEGMPDDENDLVPAEPVRGHQTGGEGAQAHFGELREAESPGDGGDERSLGEGAEEGLGDAGGAQVRVCGQLPG